MSEDPSDEQVARFVALSDEDLRAALCAQLARADFESALRLSAIARAAGRLQRSPRTRLGVANVAAMSERYRDFADTVDPRLRTYGSLRDAQALLRDKDPAEQFMLANVLAIGFAERGDRASAYELFSYAQGAAAESGTGTVVGVAERFAAHARVFGDFEVALRQYATAKMFAAKLGLDRWRVICGIEIAEVFADLGRVSEAANALHGVLDQTTTLDLRICAAPVRMLLERDGVSRKGAAEPSLDELASAALESEDERVATRAATALLEVATDGVGNGRVRAALLRACSRVQWLGGASGLLLAAIERGDGAISAAAQGSFGAALPHRAHRYLRACVLLARGIDARNQDDGDEHVRLASEAARLFAEMHLERLSRIALDTVVRRAPPPKPKVRRRKSSALTKREQEVAALLRTGAPNREIAGMLGISEHTVETHVRSILARLGLRSRWQLIEWHDEE